jgi:hypothetical protein
MRREDEEPKQIEGKVIEIEAMIATNLRTNEMEMEPERDRVVFTADRAVAQAAIAQVASCEACNPDAAWPFECDLDDVMLFSGVHTDYFMPQPPACPRCKATVTEKMLVDWK